MRSTDLYYMEQYIIGHISRSTANIKNSFTVLWWPIQLGFKFLKDILIILSLKVISFKCVTSCRFSSPVCKIFKGFLVLIVRTKFGFLLFTLPQLISKKRLCSKNGLKCHSIIKKYPKFPFWFCLHTYQFFNPWA